MKLTITKRALCLLGLLALGLPSLGCRSKDAPGARPTAEPPQWVALELATQENTLSTCIDCGCRAQAELELAKEQTSWVAFGLVRPTAEGPWEASGTVSYCGAGSFEDVASPLMQTLGTPYILARLSITPTLSSGNAVNVQLKTTLQKLSGFDDKGAPVYASVPSTRLLSFASDDAEIALPLLIANEREEEAFGVHEVLLRLRATLLPRDQVAYGTISVSADAPVADVFVDGGLVGRTVVGQPTLVNNMVAGQRVVLVRDLSGRESRSEVTLEKGQTAELSVELLRGVSAKPDQELVPLDKNPQGYAEYWRRKDAATVVEIPAGEFIMGSPDRVGEPHERPQHKVYLDAFLIDKTEVTWRQYRKFAESENKPLPPAPLWGTPADYAASSILWEEAQAYCEWAGGRLPTEAEWEKAARGTDGLRYLWGDSWDPERCNSIQGGPHRPLGVGSFGGCISPYGVLEMAGSVWEWCSDWYGEDYYAKSPSRNPSGPETGTRRLARGGAWMSQPTWVTTTYRFGAPPTSRHVHRGFRCAQDLPE